MKKYTLAFIFILFLLTGCAVKSPITDLYKLSAYSKIRFGNKPSSHSIFVNIPNAVAGYQTEDMLYTDKLYALKPFLHSAWIHQPAEMLLPLIIQSLQQSGYFQTVASGPGSEVTDYRLDTQLIELHQNFIVKPSIISFTVNIVLVRTKDDYVIGSRIMRYQIPCLKDSPYGGVLAANHATEHFTADVTNFSIKQIERAEHLNALLKRA